MTRSPLDLLVIGGGINGTAIAREAAMRGLTILLVERDDLAARTSSASSKLIHGGLRYLEHYDFRLVREALREREIWLHTAPHIVRPLRFLLPDPPGGRPWWMIRLGLLLYDLLAGRGSLPRARSLPPGDPAREPLKPGFRLAAYWDAWVDDARLVVLTARDAADRGAEVATRTELLSAERGEVWTARLSDGREIAARMIVNAAGPWVAETLRERLGGSAGRAAVRLVKGSHIVLPRWWEGDQAYLLQQPDGRVVFALPFGRHAIVGTTDVPVSRPDEAGIEPAEIDYLCRAASLYFSRPVTPDQIVWSFSGIRALFDDGAAEAKDVTRDYRLELDPGPGAKLLSVFGGKITTSRALAEEALERLGAPGRSSTASSPLPGGDLDGEFERQKGRWAQWMPPALLDRLVRAYGTRLGRLVGGAASLEELGEDFGAGLYEAEVAYLVREEFARTPDDILWRRTKLGLELDPAGQARLGAWLVDRSGAVTPEA